MVSEKSPQQGLVPHTEVIVLMLIVPSSFTCLMESKKFMLLKGGRDGQFMLCLTKQESRADTGPGLFNNALMST